ncbi:MAG: hypothetical protein IPG53_05155 [Ignavibacteriales bacterium]|nr:hypothetical protein [Ignavibacteriales bacterium]
MSWEELREFILPGEAKGHHFIYARTVCRRAEGLTVNLMHKEEINLNIVYISKQTFRFFFTAARYEKFYDGKRRH